MTKLATIEKIHSIQSHPNKEVEKLEVGKIKEWPVVIPKGQFKDGDLVVFIQIDSICPKENTYFSFLERQKYRIWNAKFKGAPSQGLVCPLSILPKWDPSKEVDGYPTVGIYDRGTDDWKYAQEGDDVTELIGITKYEKPLDISICGDAKGGFPTHLIPITDEDNLLNNPATLNEFMSEECYLTVKVDGSSMTVIYENGDVRVCSRRLEQKEGTGFWKIAEKYDLPNNLKKLNRSIAIQAEACGGKIQGNPLGLIEPTMFVFNIKELDTGEWYGWDKILFICNVLNVPPVLSVCKPFIFDDTWTIARLQEEANKVVYVTANGEIKKGEGVVLRPTKPKYSAILGKPLSVKILNQEYKQ
jgi:RNA ligase (TIGR02306 family)